MDYVMYGFLGLCGLILGALAVWLIVSIVQWLYRLIFFNFSFSRVKNSDGKVTDMEYEASHSNGKTTTAEKNEVYFKTPQGETLIDSDTLYQRVRIGEAIKVVYQERYKKPRYWDGSWELDGYRLISIGCVNNEEVEFNDPKSATYNGF